MEAGIIPVPMIGINTKSRARLGIILRALNMFIVTAENTGFLELKIPRGMPVRTAAANTNIKIRMWILTAAT
jgi:hypothetical protein